MLGLGMAISNWWHSRQYDGFVELEEDPGGIVRANLIMNGDPETLLVSKKSIRFKVKRDDALHS